MTNDHNNRLRRAATQPTFYGAAKAECYLGEIVKQLVKMYRCTQVLPTTRPPTYEQARGTPESVQGAINARRVR